MNDNTDLKKLADALMSASTAIAAIYEIAEKVKDEPDEIPFKYPAIGMPTDLTRKHHCTVVPPKRGYAILLEGLEPDDNDAWCFVGKYIRK